MGLFISGSDAVLLQGHRGYLVETLVYKSNNNFIVTVPAGFEFDGATIPDVAWSAVGHPFLRGYRRPSAVHDFLCEVKPFDSREVHKIFYEMLGDEGVEWWRRQVLFKAVNRFGPKF